MTIGQSWIGAIEKTLDIKLFDYQLDALRRYDEDIRPFKRHCLFYRTGAGKTLTSLMMMQYQHVDNVLVIAPPVTHERWVLEGQSLGISVTAISHAKFRQKNFKVDREQDIICDEYHLLGGHGGIGWKKFDRVARGLQGDIIIMSATPNYNDADRCYCIMHVLDPVQFKRGYLEFIYQHCNTQQNNFRITPDVLGFRYYDTAAEYLSDQKYVSYLPDNVSIDPEEIEFVVPLALDFVRYGHDYRAGRIMASQMEARHAEQRHLLIAESGRLQFEISTWLINTVQGVQAFQKSPKVLIYCNTTAVLSATMHTLASVLAENGIESIDGSLSSKDKQAILERFKLPGGPDVLVGTSAMATGPDGIDKVCDTMIIVQDTDDDSLRRQLVGRFLPRGADADASGKKLYRINVHPQ